MDELSDYTSPVIGFKAVNGREKQVQLTDSCTSTDPPPAKVDAVVETNRKCPKTTQTEAFPSLAKKSDDKKLANWLQRIYPDVEKELLKGFTPTVDSYSYEAKLSDIKIQPYQKLTVPAAANAQGLAVWLSVYTNNAPVLVVTTVAAHDDWCEHVDQYLKLFMPKRVPNGNFVTFIEEKSIPIKSCVKSMCTNQYNKNIFAGSTYDGDVYVWQYEQLYHNQLNSRNNLEITEKFHASPQHGCAVALDWCSEFSLLTAHSNSYVVQWNLGRDITVEAEYFIRPPTDANSQAEICTLLALNVNSFVVGTKDGSVYHCISSSLSGGKRHLEIVSLKKHLFMTSTLLRTNINGHKMLVSCDLSGEVYFHCLRHSSDDTDTTVTQIPLPFANTIACSVDGSVIYSAGDDGSLKCYRICNGSQVTIKGALKGKGMFIKSSDNGFWLVTGLYGNEFQIFSVED